MAEWAWTVLTWNGRDDTLRCLEALRDAGGRVYLADNGSTDGTVEAVRAAFPDVVLVQNGANLGFSGGNNRAIERALADGCAWVVLLNNDAVVEPGCLDALRRAAAEFPRAGVLAGVLRNGDGSIQWAGQRVGLRSGYSGRPQTSLRAREVPRAVGALMAVSREAIDAVGLLDDHLFAYVEDVDWSLRIRAAGFTVRLVPDARAVHALSASSGGDRASTATLYFGARNTVVVCERHRPLRPVGTWIRRASIAASFLVRVALVQRTPAAARAVADGVRDGIARRLGPRP